MLVTTMRVTDRPGRYLALLVVSPLLVVAGLFVLECQPWVAGGLFVFACALFAYELFWICNSVGFEVAAVPHTQVDSKSVKQEAPVPELSAVSPAQRSDRLCVCQN